MVVGVIVSVLSTVVTLWMQGYVAVVTARGAMGLKAPIKTVFRAMKPSLWQLALLAMILTFGAVVIVSIPTVLMLLFVMLAINTNDSPGMAVMLLTFFLPFVMVIGLVVLYVWLWVKLQFATSVLVIEKTSAINAMKRSWALTKHSFWPILGKLMLLSFIVSMVSQVVTFVLSFGLGLVTPVFTALAQDDESAAVGAVVLSIVVLVLTTLLSGFISIATAALSSLGSSTLYLGERFKKEGLHLKVQRTVDEIARNGDDDQTIEDPFADDPNDVESFQAQQPFFVQQQATAYGQQQGVQHPGYPPQYSPNGHMPPQQPSQHPSPWETGQGQGGGRKDRA